MKHQITNAAKKWADKEDRFINWETEESLVSMWIQEVVMKWWHTMVYLEQQIVTDRHIIANADDLSEEKISEIYLQETKEPSNVSVSVEEAAKDYLKKIDEEDCMWTEDDEQQSEQDKELIRELLDLVNMFHATMTAKDYTEQAFTDVESAITKANNYLNQ
jgi:hypothetical protein